MKQTHRILIGTVVLGGVLTAGCYGIGKSTASGFGHYEDDDHERYEHEYERHSSRSAPPPDPVYQEECGSCHMAYPAYMLPTQSWQRMLSSLDQHFAENAELDEQTRLHIETYLGSASRPDQYYKQFNKGGIDWPQRITELPGFIHEHREIPSRLIGQNAKVRSISQCDSCHQDAKTGRYDEDYVVIPGFGRWDD
jgi:hypothetical protein